MHKFLIVVSLFIIRSVFAQTHEIDSLKARLKQNTASDTLHAVDLNEISWQFLDYSADSAQKYVAKALKLSEDIGFLNGVIDAKNIQGILYRYAGESEKAIALYEEIIRLRQEQGRLEKLTSAYSNLGSVYLEKNDNANALRCYLKAFDYAKEFDQQDNQLVLMNNIGAAYKASGLNDLAIDAFKKGLELNKIRKDEFQEAQLNLNLGTVYDQQGLFQESTKYYKYAYDIFKRRDNVRQLSAVLYNLSVSQRHLHDYKGAESMLKEVQKMADVLKEDSYYASFHQAKANFFLEAVKNKEAMEEINKALTLSDTVNELPEYGSRLLIKSEIYLRMNNYAKAMEFCDKGYAVVVRTDEKFQVATSYNIRSDIYRQMGDFKSSLLYFERTVALRDSLNTEALNTKMATLNSLNELDKKESELQRSIHEKEKIEAKHKQQSAFLIGSIIIGILVMTLLVFSIRAYSIKKKDNQLLNEQKQEIQLKNSALQERQIEIENQKQLVEEKQKEILDSIHYARRIQNTLMANRELIDRNLRENFIVFKPKDIVSGDFYWATEKEDRFYLAICDSTGHGVPGAFMSLLNISFLNEAINEKNIMQPNEVLNHVRKKLIDSISQDGAQDGMDCILVCFDKRNKTITYAAAHNGPLLVHENTAIELPADKMPVGKGEVMNSFTLRTIDYKPGDTLYLYSDGFADQFGGPRGKKFKYKPLQQQLVKQSGLSVSQQAETLDKVFEEWRGKLEQVDDVVLVGIRL